MAALKAYAWQIAAAVLAGLLLAQTLRLAAATTAHATATAAWERQRAQAERAARELSENYRTLEGKNREDIAQVGAAASAALAVAVADAGRARAAHDGLRRELADYIESHRRAAQARAAAGQCAPDTGALDLLAELQRRADARAGELAAVADDARIRGAACERAYDAGQALNAER